MAGPTRILVVEDDPEVRSAIKMVLEAESYTAGSSWTRSVSIPAYARSPSSSCPRTEARTASAPWARRTTWRSPSTPETLLDVVSRHA